MSSFGQLRIVSKGNSADEATTRSLCELTETLEPPKSSGPSTPPLPAMIVLTSTGDTTEYKPFARVAPPYRDRLNAIVLLLTVNAVFAQIPPCWRVPKLFEIVLSVILAL